MFKGELTYYLYHWRYLLTVVIVIAGLILSFLSIKLTKVKNKEDLKKVSTLSILSLIWLTVLTLLIEIYAPDIHRFVVFRNKTFLVSVFKIFLSFYVFFLTLLLTKFVKWQVKKRQHFPRQKFFLLTNFVLWLIAFSFIVRILAQNPDKIFGITLFKIKNTAITFYDLITLLIILTTTEIILIFIKSFFNRTIDSKKLDEGTAVALYRLTSYFLWTISIVIGIEAMGFDITLIIAGSAALLVGLGMGIQQLFLDFVSGVILLTERQINVGDVIEVNGLVGRIIDLKFRTTIIKTRDNVSIIVPNSKLISDNVINWTISERNTRFKVTVGVAYGSDVQLVIDTLVKIAENHPEVRKYPRPFVYFEDFGDSALIFSLYFYTDKNFVVERIKSELRIEIDRQFRRLNIEIPFPQRDIHLFYPKQNDLSKNDS